jgi:hypothetical protein
MHDLRPAAVTRIEFQLHASALELTRNSAASVLQWVLRLAKQVLVVPMS